MKWRVVTKWIVLTLAILAVGLALARPWLIRFAVERTLQHSLGGEIDIGQLESNLRQSRLSLREVRIINPTAWPTDAEWFIAEITVVYDLSTLFRQTVHLQEVILDIEQIRLTLDMDSLMDLQQVATGRPPPIRPQPGATLPATADAPPVTTDPEPILPPPPPNAIAARDLQIDQLHFRLGRIDIINALFGEIEEEPVPIILNLEQTFYDVDDMERVVQALTRSLLFAVPRMH